MTRRTANNLGLTCATLIWAVFISVMIAPAAHIEAPAMGIAWPDLGDISDKAVKDAEEYHKLVDAPIKSQPLKKPPYAENVNMLQLYLYGKESEQADMKRKLAMKAREYKQAKVDNKLFAGGY